MDRVSRDNKRHNLPLFQAYFRYFAIKQRDRYLYGFENVGTPGLKTTQIYAKILDQTKRDASNKIQLDF